MRGKVDVFVFKAAFQPINTSIYCTVLKVLKKEKEKEK